MSTFVPEIAARAMMPKELLAQASLMHCCIHVHPLFIQVALAEASTGKVMWMESFDLENQRQGAWTEVTKFIRERNWAEKVFRKCTLTFDTTDYTVVPSAFFEHGKEAALLSFHTGKQHMHVETLLLSEFNARIIYEVPEEISALSKVFPNLRIFPAASLVIRFAWLHSPPAGPAIHLWTVPGAMTLMVLSDRKLMLAKSDLVQAGEDILYHVSNAAVRMGIDMVNTGVTIYSNKSSEELQKLFRQYCKEVKEGSSHPTSVIIQMHLSCV